MKSLRSYSLLLALSGAVAFSGVVFAHEGHDSDAMSQKPPVGQLVPVSAADPAWVAKTKAEYPSTTCFVSGDKLGADMGKPADFVWREKGKPDRLVSFCCKDCVRDFNKDPEKYLKELDEAKAAAQPGQPK